MVLVIEVALEVAAVTEAAEVASVIEVAVVAPEVVEAVIAEAEEAAEEPEVVSALEQRLLSNLTIVSQAFTSCAVKTMPCSPATLYQASQYTTKRE